MVIKPQDQLQLFEDLKPEIAEVWALYWQETVMAAATVDTWVGDLVPLPSCAAMKGYPRFSERVILQWSTGEGRNSWPFV